jgi:hypothetical protein
MKKFVVRYSGNASRFNQFYSHVFANSEKEAVHAVYNNFLSENYFMQKDGSVLDCDGCVIAHANSTIIEHDGGYFWGMEVQ